jgi:hypothetical protein
VVKGWTRLDRLEALTRTQILDANDWLDALEEAEDVAKAKAEAASKRT